MATQAQLNAIEAAIASGATEVTYDGVTTKYRDLNKLKEIQADLKVELGQATVTNTPYLAGYSKGYR